jgi:hypothetical protein
VGDEAALRYKQANRGGIQFLLPRAAKIRAVAVRTLATIGDLGAAEGMGGGGDAAAVCGSLLRVDTVKVQADRGHKMLHKREDIVERTIFVFEHLTLVCKLAAPGSKHSYKLKRSFATVAVAASNTTAHGAKFNYTSAVAVLFGDGGGGNGGGGSDGGGSVRSGSGKVGLLHFASPAAREAWVAAVTSAATLRFIRQIVAETAAAYESELLKPSPTSYPFSLPDTSVARFQCPAN